MESLVNDASRLVAYKYALTAITAGNFVLWQAGLNFILVVAAGIAVGLAIGFGYTSYIKNLFVTQSLR